MLPGDKVVCIVPDALNCRFLLNPTKVYTVGRVNEEYLTLKNVSLDEHLWYLKSRFKLYKKNKLKKKIIW